MSLIEDILDYSKMEVGNFKLAYGYFDPREAIVQCCDLIEYALRSKRVKLKVLID